MMRIALAILLPLFIATSTWADSLHDAARSGDVSAVKQLLGQGVDVNLKGQNDATPLIVATLEGQTAVAELLIDSGGDINNQQNRFGITPLHAAAEENHIEIVKLLLEKGADVNLREASGGYTPLSRAGYREHWDIVIILMQHGAGCQPVELVGDWLFKECAQRERGLKGTTN